MTERVHRQRAGVKSTHAPWLAWSVCALSLALSALDFVLIALILRLDTPAYFFWPELTVLAIGYSVIGAIIASRLPGHPIGWICCAIGLIAAVDHFGGEYSVYALLAQPDPLPGGMAMLWLQDWLWMLFIGLIVFLLLLFPTGRLPSSSWRPFAWGSVVVILVAVILTASMPLPSSVDEIQSYFEEPPSPIQLSVLLLGLVAAASVVIGRRNARGVERQQIKWLLYAAPIWFFGSVLKIAVFYFALVEGPWGLLVGYLLVAVGGLGGPIAIGVAILRYRLYEIDTLINRTLVYGALTAALVAVYVGSVVALQGLLRALTGGESQLAIVASTLAVAAMFTPLRRGIQAFIDRRFYRRKYDATKTLEAFAAKLRDETDLDSLNAELVGAVRETMHPAHVSLWLRPAKGEAKGRGTSELK
ncbi:MAG TPA: hypothetical protein VG127_06490 [Rubrobacteraceae bacterium]|nr:hypothetical protein [Rubrobacteraceae bacterium]